MRGVLSTCVLALVAEGETYGYVILQRLHAAGLGTIKGGTLYPILARLEQDGLVTARWEAGDGGPGRKFFAVTPSGSATLRDLTQDWTIFTERVTAVMTTREAPA